MEMSDLALWQPHSSLFTMRLWRQVSGEQPGEVRIQVRHVLSGETRYFRNWAQLEDYLEQKLSVTNAVQPMKGENKNRPLNESTE